ncbi:MAG: hypothetical protein AAFQ19_10135 [Pseudomonadota bacterium]
MNAANLRAGVLALMVDHSILLIDALITTALKWTKDFAVAVMLCARA